MLAFTARRILLSIPVLLASSILVFFLVSSGADPLEDLRARNPPVPPATIKNLEHQLRLDEALPLRYWHWLTGVLHGDFGFSRQFNNNVGTELGARLGATLRLVLMAALLAVIFAVVTGVVSAVKQYGAADYSLTLTGFLFLSLPTAGFGLLLKQLAVSINDSSGSRLFSTIGEATPGLQGGLLTRLGDQAGHLVLPVITLALISYASWSRFQRASMLEVLNSDYIRLARSKGISRFRVMVRHALRTALVPLTTVVAIDFAGLLGGAVITETIFQWRAMGDFGIRAITRGDVNSVQAWLIVTAVLVVAFNLVADLLYAVLDPRIRYA